MFGLKVCLRAKLMIPNHLLPESETWGEGGTPLLAEIDSRGDAVLWVALEVFVAVVEAGDVGPVAVGEAADVVVVGFQGGTGDATLDQAFDPWANADYGARFLAELYQKSGSWAKAVELYHSNTQEIGAEYGRRVYAALPEELKLADASHPLPPATGGWASPVNRTLLTGPLAPPPPHIIPLVPGPSGGAPAGRTLESYRSAPVRFAVRGL